MQLARVKSKCSASTPVGDPEPEGSCVPLGPMRTVKSGRLAGGCMHPSRVQLAVEGKADNIEESHVDNNHNANCSSTPVL